MQYFHLFFILGQQVSFRSDISAVTTNILPRSSSINIQLLICETYPFSATRSQQDFSCGCNISNLESSMWLICNKTRKRHNRQRTSCFRTSSWRLFLFSPLFVTRVLYNDLIIFFVCSNSSLVNVGARKSKKNSPKEPFRRRPLWGNRGFYACLPVLT